ncbi:MAG: polysaccharide biosynthesis protein [Solirubrobacterales bacterium]
MLTDKRADLLTDKRVVVTGGTGSFGKVIVRRLLEGEVGVPAEVVVFSRSEATQHQMRLDFQHRRVATDEIVYEEERHSRLHFQVGDIRDPTSVVSLLRGRDVVFHAAAMKQVPVCEYNPFEAVKTNIVGAENIVRAIRDHELGVDTVIGVSTDKACKPVNVMGMTKAVQERVLNRANIECSNTRFLTARYGNVLASRGSVVPLFHEQIRNGGPVTMTSPDMTRFLLSLDRAVDTVFDALEEGNAGETYIPRLPSALIRDMADALIGDRPIEIEWIGIRPGEKIHEILVSEEESPRTYARGRNMVIMPLLPELRSEPGDADPFGGPEYSSADETLDPPAVLDLLRENKLMLDDAPVFAA